MFKSLLHPNFFIGTFKDQKEDFEIHILLQLQFKVV